MDKCKVLLTLNDLLQTSTGGERRFRTCAQSAANVDVKRILEAAADGCAVGARQLTTKIRSLGGQPRSAGSVNGAVGMDDRSILDECERHQQIAKHGYEAALDVDLPLDVKAILERHYKVVSENHDRIRNLQDAA
ncbi:PA2169 family four-helix-bundle protein [Methylocella silvestris]|uniref:Aldehyde dehydrogenase n=1 Tax=Methylocella silvestris TaxID=199596 RepID=A0A2J7TCD6_METSI|nr:PA2169 family four-helix-bundle protein [Methylocella silvestris]PNG24433.1 aldehyde dehydrogenase [Methylocella silvestris]